MLSPPPPGKPRFNPPGLRFEGRYRLVIFIDVCVFIFIFFIFISIRSIVIIIVVVMMIMSPFRRHFHPLSLFGSQSGASFWQTLPLRPEFSRGKTTLVDQLMKQSGMGLKVTERMMDSKAPLDGEVRCLAKLEKLYGYMIHLHMINIYIYIYTYT